MKHLFTFLISTCLSLISIAQDSTAIKFAKTITAEELKTHLSILASDEYEGRETGKKGQKMAAQYIRTFFVNNKLNPPTKDGYYQPFDLIFEDPTKVEFQIGNTDLEYLKDYFVFGSVGTYTTYSGFDFRGYGIEDELYSDFNAQKQNDVVVIYDGEPRDKNGKSLLTGKKEPGVWTNNRAKKRNLLIEKGYQLAIVIMPGFNTMSTNYEHYLTSEKTKLADEHESDALPTIYVSEQTAEALFTGRNSLDKIKKKFERKQLMPAFSNEIIVAAGVKNKHKTGQGENVIAIVEGSDKINELVIITAHYDHIGVDEGEVFNGADDDGSGTVAVMEMAQAFKAAKEAGFGPRRTMVFMLVSGEEKGLLGSKYYTDHPIFPLENTVANLNIDMIGRVDEKHKGNPDYIYLIGSDKLSSDLHAISEAAAKEYSDLALDYEFNDPNDPNRFYYRSDHYNFAKNNIPVIFYFNGVHEDYHKATDTVDKIDFNKMEKISHLIFHTAWKLAHADERPEVDVINDFE